MEDVGVSAEFWRGRRVLLTGHTGFKGGWLALWLQSMGATVHGYALSPPTEPNLFSTALVGLGMASSTIADIRNPSALADALRVTEPEVIFHLAAQPLVRASYKQPVETFAVNVIGTVNLLEAIRNQPGVRVLVNVTTDKCYENIESERAYSETDSLGGYDPYSASKACAEIVTSAYRRSFMKSCGVAVATARAGNVIGGGDWAADRLIPDFLRSIDAGHVLTIRSPTATRPWQHVLEPLSGYLLLAETLWSKGQEVAEAWNFGPADDDVRSVQWILEVLAELHPGVRWNYESHQQPHEAGLLKLDSRKASERLGWVPRWNLRQALSKTIDWHQAWHNDEDMHAITLAQIAEYQRGK